MKPTLASDLLHSNRDDLALLTLPSSVHEYHKKLMQHCESKPGYLHVGQALYQLSHNPRPKVFPIRFMGGIGGYLHFIQPH